MCAAGRRHGLQFFNGFGGFSADGREYVMHLNGGRRTPAPWINVIANRDFGFQVSAEGAGFCWAGNSQQNQINAWSNDPVSNEPSEVIYLKDMDSGEVWCPTAEPVTDRNSPLYGSPRPGLFQIRVCRARTRRRTEQFVPLDDPLKIGRLTIKNASGRPRRLSVFSYVEWALGPSRAAGAPHIVTELDPQSKALFARNPHSDDFGSRIAFADMGGRQTGLDGGPPRISGTQWRPWRSGGAVCR